MTQSNLGTALLSLGERESGTARLEEAVAAYRAALQEYTRERVPLDWAMTQHNLGNALWALGVQQRRAAPLAEAVMAFRAAYDGFQIVGAKDEAERTKAILQHAEQLLVELRR